MTVLTCSGDFFFTFDGNLDCTGQMSNEQQNDLSSLFTEFLSPDPQIIGLVMGIALVFWVTGIGAGRVIQIMRKT